jgi:YHS domain-containing protein
MKEAKIKMIKDPVCGMNVDEKTTKFKSEHKGKTYYFCSQACKTSLDKNRARGNQRSNSSKYTGAVTFHPFDCR